MTRGAAWSIPVVSLAVAAPAMAASGCKMTTGQLNWSSFAAGSNQTGKVLATTGGTGVTVTISLSGDTGATGNGIVTTTSTGGKSPVMRFTSLNNVRNTSQVITITFNKPVQNLTFSLLDIDSTPGGYYDNVIISTTGFTATKHSNVIGAGTANGNGNNSGPFRAPDDDSPVAGSSADGNVDLSWVGPVNSVAFTYQAERADDGEPLHRHLQPVLPVLPLTAADGVGRIVRSARPRSQVRATMVT